MGPGHRPVKLTSSDDDRIGLDVTQIEYDAIAAALGETLEALEDWEFQTRTGVARQTMRQLLKEFREFDPDKTREQRTLYDR